MRYLYFIFLALLAISVLAILILKYFSAGIQLGGVIDLGEFVQANQGVNTFTKEVSITNRPSGWNIILENRSGIDNNIELEIIIKNNSSESMSIGLVHRPDNMKYPSITTISIPQNESHRIYAGNVNGWDEYGKSFHVAFSNNNASFNIIVKSNQDILSIKLFKITAIWGDGI